MPPGIWIFLILMTVFALKRKQVMQRFIIVMSALMIWVTSTNYFAIHLTQLANHLLHWPQPLELESLTSDDQYQKQKPQAIVILGGGRRQGALDAPQDNLQQDVSSAPIERLRFDARLATVSQLPILVTGGAPDKISAKDLSEVQLMSEVLNKELNVSVKWTEGISSTTQENAKLSAIMLQKENLNVMEAPMGFY
jgi:uncharacterized SAM-binding protein YcdF (DUF218 family)